MSNDEFLVKNLQLFNNAETAIIGMDLSYTVTFWNKAAEGIYDLTEKDVIGKKLEEILDIKESPMSRADIRMTAREEGVWRGEIIHVTKEGKQVWVDWSISMIEDEEGDIAGSFSVVRDITKRKNVEKLITVQRDLGIALSASNSFKEALRLCVEAAMNAADLDAGAIYVVDKNTGDVSLEYYIGLPPEFVKKVEYYASDSLAAALIKQGNPIYTSYDQLGIELDEIQEKEKIKAFAGLPIKYEGQSIASLNVSSREFDEIPEESREVLETIASLAGGAIASKNAEEARKQSDMKYKALFDNAKSGLAILDVIDDGEDFVFAALNRAATKIHSKKRQDVIGKSVLEVFPGFRNFGLIDVFKRVLKTGKYEVFPYVEYTNAKMSRWIDYFVYQLPSGELVAAHTDETERMLAVEQLENNEKWLSKTLDSVGDAVITTDREGTITYMNQEAEKTTQWMLKEVKDKNITEIFSMVSDNTGEEINYIEDLLDNVKRTQEEISLVIKEENKIPIMNSSAPIRDDVGDILGFVFVFRDITEKRDIEMRMRQQQRLESIGTLAGGVAHEINNPVNIIMNYADLIKESTESSTLVKDNATEIINESIRIAGIVKNLLAFSRQDKESHSAAQVGDIVEKTLKIVNKILSKDQVILNTEIAKNLPNVKCRSQQIQQVVLNLVINARDALNEKYPKHDLDKIINIYVNQIVANEQDYIRVTVEDHGNGIPAKIREKIFDPFFTSKPKDIGTGLGLSISHGIIKDHNGLLSVETKEGESTRFYMDLPVDNGWKIEAEDQPDSGQEI